MAATGIVPVSISTLRWQDYRAVDTGMILYYDTDPVSELPIREVPESLPSTISSEPNYETKTFGFYGCRYSKFRAFFVKSKLRYLFFMTKYAGTNTEYTDELVVTGFYRIKQIADVQKVHIRYLTEYSCITEDTCTALLAEEIHFVSINDAFKLTESVLKSWDCVSRVTRQTKIILSKENTLSLVEYLRSKENKVDDYIAETERLQPSPQEEEDESEEDEQ